MGNRKNTTIKPSVKPTQPSSNPPSGGSNVSNQEIEDLKNQIMALNARCNSLDIKIYFLMEELDEIKGKTSR